MCTFNSAYLGNEVLADADDNGCKMAAIALITKSTKKQHITL